MERHDVPRLSQLLRGGRRPFDKWGELEETYRFVHELKPELFGATLETATEERNKAQALAGDDSVPPLLGGDDLKKARSDGGNLGGRPTKAQELAVDEGLHPLLEKADDDRTPPNNLHADSIKVIGIGSTHVSYLVRRLKRDHPAIAEALARKEYPSARAAGIIKPPSPLDLLRRAWSRASESERQTFLEELFPPEETPCPNP